MAKDSLSPFKMNLPTGLRNRVAEAARSNNRSVSGEIIHALEFAYPAERSLETAIQELRDFYESVDYNENQVTSEIRAEIFRDVSLGNVDFSQLVLRKPKP